MKNLLVGRKDYYPPVFLDFLNKFSIIKLLFKGRVIVLNTVDSTNQYIIDNIEYVRSGDAFVAEYQTLGRGKRGKIWFSPFGQNVCLSVYWKFYQIPITIIEFSVEVSLIVARVLMNLGVSNIQVKWPNDLYVNGRKLAGILIEMITIKNSITHLIIGIGINLSMYMNKRLITNKINDNWISLRDIGIILDRNMLIATLINVLHQKLKDFEYCKF